MIEFPIEELDSEPEMHPLAEYMSDISEDLYCAVWEMSTEYALWAAVDLDEPQLWGQGQITYEHIKELKRLSELHNCWIVWTKYGPMPTSISSWQKHLKNVADGKVKIEI